MSQSTNTPQRCAIYTRKSSEQPSGQQFSSLEAQRSICSAYVKSQTPNGWVELPKHYDDDAKSGGTLMRPALQDLLSDIESGVIDVVVIYKLDRISRSLLDFIRLIDLFEQFKVSFVAVTQNFDTSDSTGRLILNVLLTFAQFEREIASDRLKDKFSAMRERGMFVGGNPPFGYDLKNKRLEINPDDAALVRWMFERYASCQRYKIVRDELAAKGARVRPRTSKRGVYHAPRALSVGGVLNILANPLYVGEVRSKGCRCPGAHEAIIDRELWDDVQAVRAKRVRDKTVEIYKTDLLRGLLYDSYGRTMSAFRDYRYEKMQRYYISNQSEWGRRHGVRRYRAKAESLEQLTMAGICAWLADREAIRRVLLGSGIHAKLLDGLADQGGRIAKSLRDGNVRYAQFALSGLIERIEVSPTAIRASVRVGEVARILRWNGVGLFRREATTDRRHERFELVEIPATTLSMKRELTVLLRRRAPHGSAMPNRHLVALLRKARSAQAALDERKVWTVTELAAEVHCHAKRFTRLVRLNYLAPDITASLLDGTQPPDLNCQKLMSVDLPMDWSLQRRLLGFPDQPDFMRAAPGW